MNQTNDTEYKLLRQLSRLQLYLQWAENIIFLGSVFSLIVGVYASLEGHDVYFWLLVPVWLTGVVWLVSTTWLFDERGSH
jgi:hypothetical protein